jgi:hypothetical protein
MQGFYPFLVLLVTECGAQHLTIIISRAKNNHDVNKQKHQYSSANLNKAAAAWPTICIIF